MPNGPYGQPYPGPYGQQHPTPYGQPHGPSYGQPHSQAPQEEYEEQAESNPDELHRDEAMERARQYSRTPRQPATPPRQPIYPMMAPPPNLELGGQIDDLGRTMRRNQNTGTAATGGTQANVPRAAAISRRPGSGVPPPGENRYVVNEVVIEVITNISQTAVAALGQRNGVTILEQLASQLTGTRLLRARIIDRRAVAVVVAALQADAAVLSAQPNYLFALQQAAGGKSKGEALQYALAKLRLPQAHKLFRGANVRVGMIDSGVDAGHPELRGAIADTFDAVGGRGQPHAHGTAIAGLIAAHARLTGAAPAARILAVRAFDASGPGARGTTFNVLKGLDWMAANGARVINLSFAGPSDPAIHRSLEGVYRSNIVAVAAAGNAGPKSPPLYPGADPRVIAVTATDAADRMFAAANRGNYIALAAPGVDLFVAAPGGAYEVSSGTSLSAAEVSGVVALMLQRDPGLGPDEVRAFLVATARTLGKDNPARLVDAYRAVSAPGGDEVRSANR